MNKLNVFSEYVICPGCGVGYLGNYPSCPKCGRKNPERE